jgi:glutaredoxin 3
MNIEIYGKDNCPQCDSAKALSQSYDYVYRKLGVDFTREQLFEQFPEARTFPQIKIDSKVIGGLTELKQYLEGKS